jgi:flagellar protein FlgJ
MVLGNDPTALTLAADAQGVAALRQTSRENPQSAIRETARQFEALLLNVMMKSMRDTVGQDGMFDSEQTRLYTSLLDQQLAQAMSKRGIGIAAQLERQLSPAAGALAAQSAAHPAAKSPAADAGVAASPRTAPPAPSVSVPQRPVADGAPASHAGSFVERLLPHAETVSRETGIPARFLLGHAALESGWGRAEIRAADGRPSHNLFGIKAGGDWQGRTVQTLTTEYVDGVPQRRVEAFRAYDSYQDAFRDYAELLRSKPRYADVLKNTHDARAYARELQEAGYATDPRYANKLAGVIEGRSLRLFMTA